MSQLLLFTAIWKKSLNAVSMLMASHLISPSTSNDFKKESAQANNLIDWKLNFETKKVADRSHAAFEPNRIQTKEYMWCSSRKNQTDQVSALPIPAPSDRQKVSQKITSVVVLSLIHNRHCQIQSEKQKLVTQSLSPALYYMWKYKTACIFLKYSCLGVSRIFNCSLF